MLLQRGTFIAGATAAAAAACRTPAAADTTVRLGVLPSIVCSQAFCALQLGYFKRRGLDVQLQTMNNGPSMAAAIAGGSLDVALSEPTSLANARLRGLNFQYIAPGFMITPAFPSLGLMVRADSGIVDAKGFNGKVIAVNAVNTFSTVATQAWIDAGGGDAKTLKFVELPLPQMAQAVDAGSVGAAFAGEPFFTIARDHGLKVIVLKPSAPAPTYMASAWFAAETWINANRETASAVSDALREGATWVDANHAAAATLLETTLKLPENSLHNLYLPAYFSDRAADLTLIQPLLDAAVKYGALARPLRAEELIARLR